MENRDPYLWKQAKARVGFKIHLRTYLLVNAGLWLLWLVLSYGRSEPNFGFPWPLWPTLGWGIGIISHYLSVYRPSSGRDMVEREYERLSKRS